MKNRNKFLTFLLLASGAAAGTALVNKAIKIMATSKHLLEVSHSLCYQWRFGKIHYTRTGSGSPLLLIHDFQCSSSSYEWHRLIHALKEKHTVYTLDLIGCGRSEKPNLTYTNYFYVQLLRDFIKSEIGHRTDVMVTGESSSFVIMACNNDPSLFNRIMLINPSSVQSCAQTPNKNTKLYKFILDLPILGTLLYNIANSRTIMEKTFTEQYFCNPYSARSAYVDHYFEAAHLGECPKAVFASLTCNYTKCNIVNALKKIDNSIYILGGKEEPNMEEIAQEYQQYNSAVEYSLIPKTKHHPQLESPEKVLDAVKIFFS